MKPILFEIGPISIYSYGTMLALAFVIATVLAVRSARTEGMVADKVLDLALIILITGIVGSRLLYVALNWSDFSKAPLNIFLLNKGGLAIYGGFALSIPSGIWFIRKNNLPIWKTADLISPSVALAQSIGRIGCFLNGCCYGKPTRLPFGVYFPGSLSKVHPTQLYSSLALFVLFSILFYMRKRGGFEGQVFFSYLILYSLFRFFIEIIRVNPVLLFGLTFYQYASIVLFALGIILYVRRKKACSSIPLR